MPSGAGAGTLSTGPTLSKDCRKKQPAGTCVAMSPALDSHRKFRDGMQHRVSSSSTASSIEAPVRVECADHVSGVAGSHQGPPLERPTVAVQWCRHDEQPPSAALQRACCWVGADVDVIRTRFRNAWLVLVFLHVLGCVQVALILLIYAWGTRWHHVATGLASGAIVLTVGMARWASVRTAAQCAKQAPWNVAVALFMACMAGNTIRVVMSSERLVPFQSRLKFTIAFIHMVRSCPLPELCLRFGLLACFVRACC